MSVKEWYDKREIFLTGVTSEFGRALLEKLLREHPHVRIIALIRSRDRLCKDGRIKSILASPRFERLRQSDPTAISRVKAVEGNLLYDDLGLSEEDIALLKNVEVVFHAGGPHNDVFKFCEKLRRLHMVIAASSLFDTEGDITENIEKKSFPNIPLDLLKMPVLGPAYTEPVPGYVDILRGPTALMIGAGYAFGNANLPAEVLPIDIAVNAFIVAAWDRGIRRSRSEEQTVYNLPSLGCTWGTLAEKGCLAKRKFSYPTFGVRGITSVGFLHWMIVFFLEWMPSALCDTILSVFGAKARCVAEHEKVRRALQSLEPIASRSWNIERNRIYQLQERLTFEDRNTYPICSDIDVESYVLCAAASARKNCVNEINLQIVKTFKYSLIALLVVMTLCFLLKL